MVARRAPMSSRAPARSTSRLPCPVSLRRELQELRRDELRDDGCDDGARHDRTAVGAGADDRTDPSRHARSMVAMTSSSAGRPLVDRHAGDRAAPDRRRCAASRRSRRPRAGRRGAFAQHQGGLLGQAEERRHRRRTSMDGAPSVPRRRTSHSARLAGSARRAPSTAGRRSRTAGVPVSEPEGRDRRPERRDTAIPRPPRRRAAGRRCRRSPASGDAGIVRDGDDQASPGVPPWPHRRPPASGPTPRPRPGRGRSAGGCRRSAHGVLDPGRRTARAQVRGDDQCRVSGAAETGEARAAAGVRRAISGAAPTRRAAAPARPARRRCRRRTGRPVARPGRSVTRRPRTAPRIPSVGAHSQDRQVRRRVGELVQLLVDLERAQEVGVQVDPDPRLAKPGPVRLEEPLARPAAASPARSSPGRSSGPPLRASARRRGAAAPRGRASASIEATSRSGRAMRPALLRRAQRLALEVDDPDSRRARRAPGRGGSRRGRGSPPARSGSGVDDGQRLGDRAAPASGGSRPRRPRCDLQGALEVGRGRRSRPRPELVAGRLPRGHLGQAVAVGQGGVQSGGQRAEVRGDLGRELEADLARGQDPGRRAPRRPTRNASAPSATNSWAIATVAVPRPARRLRRSRPAAARPGTRPPR